MRVIKIVLLFWTNENVWKKFSKPLLKMIGDHSAFRIALRKLPSSLRAVTLHTTKLNNAIEYLSLVVLPLQNDVCSFHVHDVVSSIVLRCKPR